METFVDHVKFGISNIRTMVISWIFNEILYVLLFLLNISAGQAGDSGYQSSASIELEARY
jgi:hypothetical protein